MGPTSNHQGGGLFTFSLYEDPLSPVLFALVSQGLLRPISRAHKVKALNAPGSPAPQRAHTQPHPPRTNLEPPVDLNLQVFVL